MANETEIIIVPVNSFVFALPEMPEDKYIEVTVNYTRDSENNVTSEAWLHEKGNKAVMFLADICSFADNGQTEDEIENRLLEYYNGSEVFSDSVIALLSKDYNYFMSI